MVFDKSSAKLRPNKTDLQISCLGRVLLDGPETSGWDLRLDSWIHSRLDRVRLLPHLDLLTELLQDHNKQVRQLAQRLLARCFPEVGREEH